MGRFLIDIIFIKWNKFFLVVSGYTFFNWIPLFNQVEQPKELFEDLKTWVLVFTILYYLLGIIKRGMDMRYDKKNQKQREINDKIVEDINKEKRDRERAKEDYNKLMNNDR